MNLKPRARPGRRGGALLLLRPAAIVLGLALEFSLGCASAPAAPAPAVPVSIAPAPMIGSSTRLLAVCSARPGEPVFLECAGFLVAVLDLQVTARTVCFQPGASLAEVVDVAVAGLRAAPGDEEAAQLAAAALVAKWPCPSKPTFVLSVSKESKNESGPGRIKSASRRKGIL